MKVSKNSWHYRFNNYMQDGFSYRVRNEVFSTCSYLRTTMFSMFIALMKLLVSLAGIVAAVLVVVSMVALPFMAFGVMPALNVLIPFGVGGWGMVLLFGLACLADKMTPFFRERKERRMSLLKQTLQDKKDGVCTLVEFE